MMRRADAADVARQRIQFKMHAEMMQKMGEIAAKYADRVKEDTGRR